MVERERREEHYNRERQMMAERERERERVERQHQHQQHMQQLQDREREEQDRRTGRIILEQYPQSRLHIDREAAERHEAEMDRYFSQLSILLSYLTDLIFS